MAPCIAEVTGHSTHSPEAVAGHSLQQLHHLLRNCCPKGCCPQASKMFMQQQQADTAGFAPVQLTWVPWLGPACKVQIFAPPHNVLALGQGFYVVEPAEAHLQNLDD